MSCAGSALVLLSVPDAMSGVEQTGYSHPGFGATMLQAFALEAVMSFLLALLVLSVRNYEKRRSSLLIGSSSLSLSFSLSLFLSLSLSPYVLVSMRVWLRRPVCLPVINLLTDLCLCSVSASTAAFIYVPIRFISYPFSGGFANPARSFGPAMVAVHHSLEYLWIYLSAPFVGTTLAVLAFIVLHKEIVVEPELQETGDGGI